MAGSPSRGRPSRRMPCSVTVSSVSYTHLDVYKRQVWDYYCMTKGVPGGDEWLEMVRQYEKDVLIKR